MENDWRALAKFVAAVRRSRRQSKRRFENMHAAMGKRDFYTRRDAWRSAGKFACRHGVLFSSPPACRCPCLEAGLVNPTVWAKARCMPALDDSLKTIVAVPFDAASYRRLGELQAEMRRRDW